MESTVVEMKKIRLEVQKLPSGQGLNERKRNMLYQRGKRQLVKLFPNNPEQVSKILAEKYGI